MYKISILYGRLYFNIFWFTKDWCENCTNHVNIWDSAYVIKEMKIAWLVKFTPDGSLFKSLLTGKAQPILLSLHFTVKS